MPIILIPRVIFQLYIYIYIGVVGHPHFGRGVTEPPPRALGLARPPMFCLRVGSAIFEGQKKKGG
jgi:hypothetical protein